MTVSYFEYTLFDGQTSTGTSEVIDLRGKGIKSLWVSTQNSSGTWTAQLKVGLTEATCDTTIGHYHSNGSTSPDQDLGSFFERLVFPKNEDACPPFIKAEVTSYTSGSAKVIIYGEGN